MYLCLGGDDHLKWHFIHETWFQHLQTPLECKPGDDDVDLGTTGAQDPARLLHRDPAQAEWDDNHDVGGDIGFVSHEDGGDIGFDSHDDIYPMEKQNMIKKTEYCVLDAHKKYFTLLHSHLLSRLQSGIDHPCKNILL